MSCNFYDTTGAMLGLDLHKYWVAAPPSPVPVEGLAAHVNAAQYYISPVEDPKTLTASVTSDAKRMVQGKCKLEWVPHFPVIVPGLPYPGLEHLELLLIMGFSSSVPVVRRQSVTGERQPMAICMVSAIGLNLNCGEKVKLPTGWVLNFNTVKTGISWQDLVPVVVEWVIDSLAGLITKKLSKKFLEKLIKKIGEDYVERIVKKKAEDILKTTIKEIMKFFKDKATPKAFLHDIGVPFV